MNQHRSDEAFDSWLAEALQSRHPDLDDEGFSERVMTAVAATPTSGRLRPYLWSLVLALVTAVLTLWLFPGWDWLFGVLATFTALPLVTLLQIGVGLGLGMMALAGLLLWQSGVLEEG